MRLALPKRPFGWALLGLGGIVLAVALLAIVLATIDPGRFKGKAEAELSRRFGRPVTIGALSRDGGPSLSPVMHATDIRVSQPAWAPPGTPPMAAIRDLRLKLPLIPLLIGKGKPERIEISGMRLLLLRDPAGRANWQGGKKAGKPTGFARLMIRDSQIVLNDAQKDRSARLTLAAEPENGFRADGTTLIHGVPGRLSLRAQVGGLFTAQLASANLDATLAGRMGPAFNSGKFTARMQASGADLHLLDAVIEAGLPATQPFALHATIEHDQPDWIITDLGGKIGRSQVAGHLTVRKRDGRSTVEGALNSTGLDFDDLADDARLARAAAQRRILGPRLVPGTRIALDKLRRTDASVDFRIDRLLWKTPTPFRSARGHIALDHGVLTIDPLRVTLPQGVLTGTVKVVHADGQPSLTLDLTAKGGRLTDLLGDSTVTGDLAARVKLVGVGRTVRAAMAGASGSVALVSRNGSIDRRTAELLGRNVGRAAKVKAGERTPMRCLIARFAGTGGRFTPAPLVLDTGVMRADGSGTLLLSTERWALTLNGTSKVPAAFRLSGPILVTGTIKRLHAAPAAEATSRKGILRSIGNALGGPKEAAAVDADCAGLAAQALR